MPTLYSMFVDRIKSMTRQDREKYEPRYVVKTQPKPRRAHGWKLRGTGYTRQVHETPKYRRKMAVKSQRINRQRAK
jgi:hypothetical protein